MADTRLQAVATADHRPGRPSPGVRDTGQATAAPVVPSHADAGPVAASALPVTSPTSCRPHVFAHPSRSTPPASVRVGSASTTGIPRSCRPSRTGIFRRRRFRSPSGARPVASREIVAALRGRGSMGADRDSIDIVPH